MAKIDDEAIELATFGGGCFWCMQPPFENTEGVISAICGYAGGTSENPTYEEVCSGQSGHVEVVQVTFDKRKVSYQQLLDVFWRQIDPTTENQQFADIGTQYRTVIFYHSDEQKEMAIASKQAMDASGTFNAPIVTRIEPLTDFYPAEEFHQDYYKKNPTRYKNYHIGSGRAHYLSKTWNQKNNQDE